MATVILSLTYHEVKTEVSYTLQSNLPGMRSYMYLIDQGSALLDGTGLHFETQINNSAKHTLAVQPGDCSVYKYSTSWN